MVDNPMRSCSLSKQSGDTVTYEPTTSASGAAFRQQLVEAHAIYAVEASSASQRKEIDEFFAEIGAVAQTSKLSTGRLVSYAVQTVFAELLDEIAGALYATYEHVLYVHPADEVAVDVISDICRATHSKMLPVPQCGICGKRVLFPPTMVVVNGRGSRPIIRHYCPSCTADKCRPKIKDFVRALLDADARNLKGSRQAKLVRRKSRRDMAFTIACTSRNLME